MRCLPSTKLLKNHDSPTYEALALIFVTLPAMAMLRTGLCTYIFVDLILKVTLCSLTFTYNGTASAY